MSKTDLLKQSDHNNHYQVYSHFGKSRVLSWILTITQSEKNYHFFLSMKKVQLGKAAKIHKTNHYTTQTLCSIWQMAMCQWRINLFFIVARFLTMRSTLLRYLKGAAIWLSQCSACLTGKRCYVGPHKIKHGGKCLQPSIGEVMARESEVQGDSWLPSRSEANFSYMRPCL